MSKLVTRRNPAMLELEHQRDLLRRQQERDQRVLAALYNISLACRERPDFQAIFRTIQRELATVFSFDAAYIAFCDERPGHFKCALFVDEGLTQYLEEVEYGQITGHVVRSGQPLLYRDLVTERDPALGTTPFGNHEKRSHSWLGVPLLIGRTSVGVISLQSYTIGLYNETTQDLLQRMANVLAVALENVALIERMGRLSEALASQVDARTEELNALSAISAGLVERRPLEESLIGALDIVLGLLKLEAGNVRLLDEPRENLVLYAQRGFSEAYVERTWRSPLGISPIREVVFSGQPTIITRDWCAHYQGIGLPFEVFPTFESSLILPLVIGSVVTGTLSLFGFASREFDEHTVSLGQSVANQIAIVVENTRLLEEHERQIAELRALGEVSTAASTAQDARALLQSVHDALRAFLPLDVFSMIIYDPERGVVTNGLTLDQGQPYSTWDNEPPPPHSLTAYMLLTGEALRFGDLPAELQTYPKIDPAPTGSQRPSRSWLGMPMRDRDGCVIGMISIQSYTPNVFSARDEYFLHSVAAQVALHIQNMRLLAQRERQIAELEVIGQIGKLITASADLDQMLAEVYRVFSEATGSPVFALLICEAASGVITNAVFVQQGEWIPLDLVGHKVIAGSLSDWILTNREPLLFHDLAEQTVELVRRGITPHSVVPARPIRSWAGVPVVARNGELIGVLSIQDYRPYCYDSGIIDLLNQVASHISLGVQKVRLFQERERLLIETQSHAEAAERQAHRIALVHRIASVLSARLDQREILDLAARELVQLFWADHTGTVMLIDEDRGYLAAEYPNTGNIGRELDLRDNPVFKQIMATRQPVVITDFDHDPLALASRNLWRAMGIQSLVIVPLISRDHVFGSISLDSYKGPLIFSADELELMMTVATSIAAAIENARLFAAEQEQRRTADTLREMARVLSSTFDPDEVLRLVLNELGRVINFDTASIMLLDGTQLRMVAFKGWPAAAEPRGLSLPLAGSAAGAVVYSREPLLYVQGRSDAPWMRLPTAANIRSWLGVPLIARGRVLGVLNIDSRIGHDCPEQPIVMPARIFTERDVEVARTFANHAALAIENARLYKESVTRVEQEMEIARRIQSNLFPRELPAINGLALAACCLPARETGGDFYDLIEMGTRLGVIVGDVSGKSLPAAMLMAVARSITRSEVRNHETPWVVLTETNQWLVGDVPRNSFVALSYALVDPQQRRLILASGGQLAPLLRRADGTTCYIAAPECLPLGLSLTTEFSEVELALSPGDTLVFYTDGIIESHDQNRKLFGFERLEQIVRDWGHLTPNALVKHILSEVHAFSEGMPTHDDMTLVVAKLD